MTADQMKEFEREIWRSHIRASVEEMQRAVSTLTLALWDIDLCTNCNLCYTVCMLCV